MGQRFRPSAFNLLAEQIAIVDERGMITDVNESWRRFARENGSRAENSVGINYFEVCERALNEPNGEEAAAARAGIKEVLDFHIPAFHLEYPCHSPDERRWFQMSVTRLDGEAPVVAVSHLNITRRKAMERELRAAAEQDQLTGLPNRSLLLHRLQQHCDRSRTDPGFCFAVLFIDFDRFRLVNDTLGHAAGDELLIAMARRLNKELATSGAANDGSESFTARLGGDEFVYVAAGIDGISEARIIADRLQTALSAPYELTSQTFQSSTSIGITIGGPTAGGPHELLRSADTAMNEAKRAGRGNTAIFDVTMHDRLKRALRVEAGLRLALQRQEFTLLYQPIVDLKSGAMICAEALLRWDHPEMGKLSPDEFIPIAEETGLIVPIGEWVLRQSCLQWARWQREDPRIAPPSVSVNLSRRQMVLGNLLLLAVSAALEQAGMPSSALQLEITEREVMKDPAGARELLLGLSAIGVRLAMDDFGTGTSSLGCLRDYPFHSIKIDKSFITDLSRDPQVLAVAHATVNVIASLGMISVAEGVEASQQLAILMAMGCRYGQGYLFGRPMPAHRLLAAMAAKG